MKTKCCSLEEGLLNPLPRHPLEMPLSESLPLFPLVNMFLEARGGTIILCPLLVSRRLSEPLMTWVCSGRVPVLRVLIIKTRRQSAGGLRGAAHLQGQPLSKIVAGRSRLSGLIHGPRGQACGPQLRTSSLLTVGDRAGRRGLCELPGGEAGLGLRASWSVTAQVCGV